MNKKEWKEKFKEKIKERKSTFKTSSGINIEPFFTPDDVDKILKIKTLSPVNFLMLEEFNRLCIVVDSGL